MARVTKILAPTDLSDLSCLGVRYALEMARDPGAEVVIYHSIGAAEDWIFDNDESDPVRIVADAQTRRLDRLVRERFKDYAESVKIRQIVEHGVPYKKIVEKAELEKVDMIIMSTHGRAGLNHLILGSVTEKVIAHAPCPVLVVPRRERSDVAAAA